MISLLTGCEGADLRLPDPDDLEPGELSAASTEPAGRYNGPMGNQSECIRLRESAAPALMYDFEGSATGYRFDGAEWGYSGGTWSYLVASSPVP